MHRSTALKVAAIYGVFGMLWIAGSDRLLEILVADPHGITVLQTYKGWAFVAVSTILVYLSIVRGLRAEDRAEATRRKDEGLHETLAELAEDLVFVAGRDEILQYLNPAAAAYFGGAVEDLTGRPLKEVFPSQLYVQHVRRRETIFEAGKTVSFEGRIGSGDRWFDTLLTPLKGEDGDPVAVLGVAREITRRRMAEANIELQVQRLEALRTIDTAITSSHDLRLTLDVVLNHVTEALGVDAGCVLLLASHSPTLEYAAGRGFHSTAVTRSSVRLGEGYAGRAALERRIMSIRDVAEVRGPFVPFSLLEIEAFSAYWGVPLVAKGQVKGVLEIYHRSPLDPDPGWLQFLEALATDAAIAIDNAALFDDLQRLNTELELAYDATLEGWGRALELRDEETEGHTRRVTELTVRLAQAMEVSDSDLTQIRRGSFLHDIGKIGIPDRILLKTEPLTEEEWAIMRMHPVHAFHLLQPIRYLRASLDIPYCHHEHWDGSGYPRGLRGAQIPLAARIFTVVDVWDALVSRRPYHKETSESEVREYIQSKAGTLFDPEVVKVFLDIM